MIGRVRLKSNILPGSPANEGSAVRAFDNTAANRGFAAFGSSAFLLRERKELFSLARSRGHHRVHDCKVSEQGVHVSFHQLSLYSRTSKDTTSTSSGRDPKDRGKNDGK